MLKRPTTTLTPDVQWFVYILKCTNGSLYTGVSTDVQRRFQEHTKGKKGAKYTRAHKPVKIVYLKTCISRSEAQEREAAIKKMTRAEKLSLITLFDECR